MIDSNYLATALGKIGIFEPWQLQAFGHFLGNVERLGTPLGLTEAKGNALIDDHLIDSLLIYPYLEQYPVRRLCDVGSGAGFPGLALAIAFPTMDVTLVERMQKRASFLQMVVKRLGLTNVKVINAQIQEVDDYFDGTTFRALTQMSPQLVKVLLRSAPRIIAYKGRLEVVQAEALSLEKALYCTRIIDIGQERRNKERHILEITKT